MKPNIQKIRNNKHENTVYVEVPVDQIDEIYKLKQAFEEPTENVTNAMIDELTDGRGEDDIHE